MRRIPLCTFVFSLLFWAHPYVIPGLSCDWKRELPVTVVCSPMCFPGKHMDASHTQPSECGSCINLLWGARNKYLFTPDRPPRENEGFHQSPVWWTKKFGLTFWSSVRSYVEDHEWPPKSYITSNIQPYHWWQLQSCILESCFQFMFDIPYTLSSSKITCRLGWQR